MNQTVRTTLEQGRAKYAYECAEEGNNCHNKKKEINGVYYKDSQYKSYVKKIPMLIKTNGLGATFAFVLSKKAKAKKGRNGDFINPGEESNPKNAYDLIYLQVWTWINNDNNKHLISYKRNNETLHYSDFMRAVTSMDSSDYRILTIEVLAFFNWLRRFAEGLIKDD